LSSMCADLMVSLVLGGDLVVWMTLGTICSIESK
jgi:hypothetical protein